MTDIDNKLRSKKTELLCGELNNGKLGSIVTSPNAKTKSGNSSLGGNLIKKEKCPPLLSTVHKKRAICKRPELYVGLGPWDFLVDSCNIPETEDDGNPFENSIDAMKLSQKRLELTVAKLDEIIIRFRGLVEETCIVEPITAPNKIIGKSRVYCKIKIGNHIELLSWDLFLHTYTLFILFQIILYVVVTTISSYLSM